MSDSEECVLAESLDSEIEDTQQIILDELQNTKIELKATRKKLSHTEKLYKKAVRQNEELKKERDHIKKKAHKYKKLARSENRKRTCHVATQTPPDGTVPSATQHSEPEVAGNGSVPSAEVLPDWGSANTDGPNNVEGMSVAEQVKAAAEDALHQSGVVYDDRSGMYYDYNSGYYYDAERSLYYEPHSGTYYYYDNPTGEYKFHSQVDVTQYSKKSYKHGSQNQVAPHKGQLGAQEKPKKIDKNTNSNQENGTITDVKHKTRKKNKKKKEEKGVIKDDSKLEDIRDNTREDSKKGDNSEETQQKMLEKIKNEDIFFIEEDKDAKMDVDETNVASGTSKESAIKNVEIRTETTAGDHKEAVCGNEAEMESDLEEGEVSSTSDSSQSESGAENSSPEEESAVHWPPCIRVMVTESDVLDVGQLFIVTVTGATIGREKSLGHGIHIPDLQISKMHADIKYSEDLKKYVIKDHASQNGTFVNGTRISQPKVMSEPNPLSNGDKVKIGGTTLQLHIHPGTDTCAACEPGLVLARLQQQQKCQEVDPVVSKEDREQKRRQQLKLIKRRYGLESMSFTNNSAAINNPAYKDKAQERRKVKGSDNPYQKEEAPASVDRAISEKNKGHKLLAKMGWKEGQSLGKKEQGIKEPIKVQLRLRPSAGLGSAASIARSIDEANLPNTSEKWLKAQERFAQLTGVTESDDDEETVTQGSNDQNRVQTSQITIKQSQKLQRNQWVKGKLYLPEQSEQSDGKS